MAKEMTPEERAAAEEKKRLQDEKKQLKREQQAQKKEAKRRAREIAKKEDELAEDEETNGFVTFGTTALIVVLWLAVICIVIKMDVGGFGSTVLTPLLKDVPLINRILPGSSLTETTNPENYGGYSSLQEAVAYINQLEVELERTKNESAAKDEELVSLRAEVVRLQEFEKMQVEFQRISQEFYEEVVYAENGPGPEEYKKFYEAMNPTTAEYIYRQVIVQLEESAQVQDYAQTYAEMKPKAAAALIEEMTDNLNLAARILKTMNAEDRAKIFDAMDPAVAARLTKIMDPQS